MANDETEDGLTAPDSNPFDFLNDPAPAAAPAQEKPAAPPVEKRIASQGEASADDPDDVVNPFNGEVFAKDDVDNMWLVYSKVKEHVDELSGVLAKIRANFAKLTENGTTNTRRARGEKFVIAVEWPSTEFTSKTILDLWLGYPNLKAREEILAIEKVKVKKTELKKALETSGSDEYNAFVKAVKQAEYPSKSMPSIKLDKVLKTD